MRLAQQKVIVFIDGSNLYHNLMSNFGKHSLDFKKFVDFLLGAHKLVKTYYYNAPLNQRDAPTSYKNQQRFFSYLKKTPKFEIKLGRLEKRPKGPPAEKGVDVRMAVDIVTHAYSNIYDIAIVVSGDADFIPAIKAAQDFGKKVINVRFPQTKSFHLNQVYNETILIENADFKKLCWKKAKNKNK